MHEASIMFSTSVKIVLLLLTLSVALPVFAQKDSTTTSKKGFKKPPRESLDRTGSMKMDQFQRMDQVIDPNQFGLVYKVDNRYEGVQGTPYFLNSWVQGSIDLVNGKNFDDVPLKYDAFSQNLILRRDNMRDSIVVFPTQVKQFVLRADDGAEWLFRRYPDVNVRNIDLKDGYFLVLYDGKTSLLKRVSKVFKKADYKDPYSTNVRYDAYNNDFTYYILRPDKSLVKIKKSKKALYDALNDKGANLDAFASQENLAFKSDTDFARVVKYYDGL